ncbi:beta-ketoacyl-ACP synthase III [Uliginosibacterium sp. H3]|uniref:Beta-ketoacyl-ACP synthase III n=1 Tax=Uliginosibacterium silvisoli TaxID=3114758 RepID=A0ABU6K354_9RHOO|nr:beta-ketoacyl-ACP synthase III [Uliginosibacterium sp. H3]
MTSDVFITRTASFLPHEPVSNDEIENVLGMIDGKPSRARRLILRSNGIQSRHYALDRTTRAPSMSNAQMTANAIRGLGDVRQIDCLATGTSMPDQFMPNHAVMVHGELGWPQLEAVAFSGICVSGAAALKYAWLSVKAGNARRAIATGSELCSPALRGEFFQAENDYQIRALETAPQIAFEKDFLRWMLSDGAGTALLESQPSGPLSLRVEWIDLSSAANQHPACMYLGAEKNDDGSLRGWFNYSSTEWAEKSIFAVKQDVKLLNENVIRATLKDPLAAIKAKRGLRADDIDWFLPHISSMYFAEPVADGLKAIGLPIPRERWFSNLTSCGNTGSASPYIMLDELFRSGRIERGQRILMYIPESGRFSSAFVMLQAV